MWPLITIGALALLSPKRQSARAVVGTRTSGLDEDPIAVGISSSIIKAIRDPEFIRNSGWENPPPGSLSALVDLFGDPDKAGLAVDYLIDNDATTFAIYRDVDIYGNSAFRVQFRDKDVKRADTLLELYELIRKKTFGLPGLFYIFDVDTGHLMTELRPMKHLGKKITSPKDNLIPEGW